MTERKDGCCSSCICTHLSPSDGTSNIQPHEDGRERLSSELVDGPLWTEEPVRDEFNKLQLSSTSSNDIHPVGVHVCVRVCVCTCVCVHVCTPRDRSVLH